MVSSLLLSSFSPSYSIDGRTIATKNLFGHAFHVSSPATVTRRSIPAITTTTTKRIFTTTPDPITTTTTQLYMAGSKATKKKPKKKNKSSSTGSGGGGGLRGFGSPTLSSSLSSSSTNSKQQRQQSQQLRVDIDRSKSARDFYDFLEKGKAGDNLNRCALGNFWIPITEDDDDGGSGSNNDTENNNSNNSSSNFMKLRGVVALRPIKKKGDTIINIPYDLAINLGQEGSDPTIPAVTLLRDYCETLSNEDNNNNPRAVYYKMLPPFGGVDCLGSTDFFSDHALQELQSPLVVEETLQRRQLVEQRFQSDIESDPNFPSWIDNMDDDEEEEGTTTTKTKVTSQHLLWAVWLITSRVLTVQGGTGGSDDGFSPSSPASYRLLIPFLDMCNHDRSSTHILTGRAVPGGELKVVAGGPVKEGDPINIVYGGGNAGNNRFLQDYGFLDTTSERMVGSIVTGGKTNNNGDTAYRMVAEELIGKRRVVEGARANRYLSELDRTRSLEALKLTTISQDERLLADETDPSLLAAFRYRLGVKRALVKLGAFDDS